MLIEHNGEMYLISPLTGHVYLYNARRPRGKRWVRITLD